MQLKRTQQAASLASSPKALKKQRLPTEQTEQSQPAPTSTLPPVLSEPCCKCLPEQIFYFLTSKWKQVHSQRDQDEATAICWYDGVQFSCADFASLMHQTTRSAWLNDNVLDFVSKLINNHADAKQCLTYTTHLYDKYLDDKKEAKEWVMAPLYSKCLISVDSLLVDKLLLPINLARSHWVLVAIFIRCGQVFVLDPYCPNQPNTKLIAKINPFIEWLQSFVKPLRSITFEVGCAPPFELPQQNKGDSSNCGVYVILYMMMFASETYALQYEFPTYRGRLAYWIMTKKLPLKQF